MTGVSNEEDSSGGGSFRGVLFSFANQGVRDPGLLCGRSDPTHREQATMLV